MLLKYLQKQLEYLLVFIHNGIAKEKEIHKFNLFYTILHIFFNTLYKKN